jgi:hypothetical protein
MENDMGGTSSMHEKDEKYINLQGKDLFEDLVVDGGQYKIDLRVIGCNDVGWICLYQDRIQ